jgi:hypothetical protein
MNPTLQLCFAEINRIAGFPLTPAQRGSFLRYHAYITAEPRPAYIARLQSSGSRWQTHSGILGNTQNALASVYYHLANIERIESGVEAIIDSSRVRDTLGRLLSAGGNTIALDSEYQAFILAVRRCLDYLTRSLAAYFMSDFHSFRRFGNFLETAQPAVIARQLLQTHARHVVHFAFVLSDSERRSTRDQISHYEFVPAGVINITTHGVLLAGGGENLLPSKSMPQPSLRDVLQLHARNLQKCIDDFLDTFVTASSAYETESNHTNLRDSPP